VGTLGAGAIGLNLADLHRLSASSTDNDVNCILLFLVGGPSQLDTWDLKPEAPAAVRGPFRPIRTNVPGIDICEHFPRMAQMADKFVFIRSLVDCDSNHDAYQCMTGRKKNQQLANFWPAMGSWVSRLQGPANPAMPAHCTLMYP